MSAHHPSLSIGNPKFSDPRLADLARNAGVLTAWLDAVNKAPALAATTISGDFAVGLRDSAGRTFLAVDRFGIRTLCYRLVDKELRFAARADELADSATEIDPQAIFDYLFFHAIPSPRTIFKGIFRLPPGHYALFDNGELTVDRYWTPKFVELHNPSFADLREEFRGLLRDAVADQLDGSKPACFLSGGTDSSTVAGMMAAVSGWQVSTYSIGFDAAGYDEMEFARIAVKRFKTSHHEYYVTPDDLVRSIGKVASHYDQPFGNSSSLPAFYCASMAKEDGVSRILAGDGGDELFGGNTRYAMQRIFGWYGLLPAPVRQQLMEPVFGLPVMRRLPLLRKGSGYIGQARVPMPDRLNMHNLLIRLGVTNILTPAFLSSVNVEGPLSQQRPVWAQASTDSALERSRTRRLAPTRRWPSSQPSATRPRRVVSTSGSGHEVP